MSDNWGEKVREHAIKVFNSSRLLKSDPKAIGYLYDNGFTAKLKLEDGSSRIISWNSDKWYVGLEWNDKYSSTKKG